MKYDTDILWDRLLKLHEQFITVDMYDIYKAAKILKDMENVYEKLKVAMEMEQDKSAKYISAIDPILEKRVIFKVINGYAISLLTGYKFKYKKDKEKEIAKNEYVKVKE